MRKIKKIIIHCSATPPSLDVGAEWIRDLHVNERGWSDIGYHYVITRNGSIEYGRQVPQIGAHARGYNANSIGICMIGGVKEGDRRTPEDNFTSAQYHTLANQLDELKHIFPEADILGHCDLEGVTKACPCFDVREWLDEVGIPN